MMSIRLNFKSLKQRYKHNDMSRILLIGWFLFACFGFGFSQNVKWLSWDEAVTSAKNLKAQGKKGKVVFVNIYTDWCTWCKRMEQQTFEQQDIAQVLNANFLPVKLNAEQKQDVVFNGTVFKYVLAPNGKYGIHQLAYSLMDYRIQYPTVVFLDSDFHTIQILPGYLDPQLFYIILGYMTTDRTASWEDYKNNFYVKKNSVNKNNVHVVRD